MEQSLCAVMITGSSGIGKTNAGAHLCAKLEGFTPIELNASDTRSKRRCGKDDWIPSRRFCKEWRRKRILLA